jgi:hypothetical protein
LVLQESLLLFVPSFNPRNARCASPLPEEAEGSDGDQEAAYGTKFAGAGWSKDATSSALRPQSLSRGSSLLRHCYPSSSVQGPIVVGHLEECLPPCYHSVKAMTKLVKVGNSYSVEI